MNSKNLSKAINRVLAILLTAAMVAGSFTVPAKADVAEDELMTASYVDEGSEESAEGIVEAEPEEEIIEEGVVEEGSIEADDEVQEDYPYEVSITVPDFAADGHTEKYSWTSRNVVTDLIDKIEIKSVNGGQYAGKQLNKALADGGVGLTVDTYTTNVGDLDHDYCINVYTLNADGETWDPMPVAKRKSDATGLDVGAAGKYKLVVDVHEKLGRWTEKKEYIFEVTKYKLADFDKYLEIVWDGDAEQAGPKYKGADDSTQAPVAIDPSTDAAIRFIQDADIDAKKLKEIMDAFPGITEAVIDKLQTNLGTGSDNTFLVKWDDTNPILNAESDVADAGLPEGVTRDDYLWAHEDDSTKVVKNVKAESDKPHIQYTTNGSYSDGTNKLNDFIDIEDEEVFSKPFTIIDGAMANDTVIVEAAKVNQLNGKDATGSTDVKYSTSSNKAEVAIKVDVPNKVTNTYAFDLKDYFAKINTTYSELEKVELANSPGNYFKSGSVSITNNTVLNFKIDGTSSNNNGVASSNNTIVLDAKYSNYDKITVEITVDKEAAASAADTLKWAGKVAEGGLKIPYKAGSYPVANIVKTKAGVDEDTPFAILAADGEDLGTPANLIKVYFQKQLNNGLWGNVTEWTATSLKDVGTYRARADYATNGSDVDKIVYSPSFEIIPAELTTITNVSANSETNGLFPYDYDGTGTALKTDIFDLTGDSAAGTFKFTTNAGENTLTAGVAGQTYVVNTAFTIEYFNCDKGAYKWDTTKDIDTTFVNDGNICHLAGGNSLYMYKDQPYAKIVSKIDEFDKTKPLYVTFDLKAGKDSLFAIAENTETYVKPAAEEAKYEIDLPADIFSYELNTADTAVKTAVAADDVTGFTVAMKATGTTNTTAVVWTNPVSKKPYVEKTAKGYKLVFYTTSTCAKGDVVMFEITPKLGWPYQYEEGGAGNKKATVEVTFDNVYTVTLRNNHRTYKKDSYAGEITGSSAKSSYNVKINGTTVKTEDLTSITATVYREYDPENDTTLTAADKKTVGGITYNIDSSGTVAAPTDAGNYLINVTAVSSSAVNAELGEVWLPFVIDKYELTESDIFVKPAVAADTFRAETDEFDGFKNDIEAGTSTKTTLRLIAGFDGSARTFATTTLAGVAEQLTRDESVVTPPAKRGNDTYYIEVSGPTTESKTADTFKYDITFKLNEDVAKQNYKMAAAGIKKTIVVKKVDVGMTSARKTAEGADYTVAATSSVIIKNGADASGNFVYNGYEKQPKVQSVTITVTNDTGGAHAAYTKTIKKNAGISYPKDGNIEVGNGEFTVDFSEDEIMYKGSLKFAGSEAFTIAQRSDGLDGHEENPYIIKIPEGAKTTTVQLPLDGFKVDSSKVYGVTEVSATGYGDAAPSVTKTTPSSSDFVVSSCAIANNGEMTITTTGGNAGDESQVFNVTPKFKNFDSTAAAGQLKVKLVVADATVVYIEKATENNPEKIYDGSGASNPEVKIHLASGEHYTSGVTAESLGIKLKYQWYENDGTTLLAEAPKDAAASAYKCKVSIDPDYNVGKDGKTYIADVVTIPYTIKKAPATVTALTKHFVYNGKDQAGAVVKDANGKELELNTDYAITVYQDNYNKITNIKYIEDNLPVSTSNYKNAGKYKVKVVGAGNYTIDEADAPSDRTANSGVVVGYEIDKAPLTITPKSSLVQYKHESPKNTYALVDADGVTGIATVEGLITDETVALATGAGTLKATKLTTVAYPTGATLTPIDGTITEDDLTFSSSPENYDITYANDGKFQITFAKLPVTVNLKLYDGLGNEITGPVLYTGEDLAIDYKVTVATPDDLADSAIVDGRDYEVVVPTGIREAKDYEITLTGIDDSAFAVASTKAILTVSEPEAIEVDAAIKVGTAAIKNDGTSQIGQSAEARKVTAAVTNKKGGAALTEGEDYTITVVKKGTTTPLESVLDLGKYTVTIESTNKTYSFDTITVEFEIIETVIVVNEIKVVEAKPATLKAEESAKVTYKVTGTENGEAADLTDKVSVTVASEKGAEGNFTYSSTASASPITITAKAGAKAGDKETFTISYVEGETTVKDTFTLKIKADNPTPTPGTDDEYTKEEDDKRISIAGATVTGIKSYTYKGEAVEPAPTVKLGNKKLKLGQDYRIYYDEAPVAAGTYDIHIVGINDYRDEAVNDKGYYTFEIKPVDIKSSSVKVSAGTITKDSTGELDYDTLSYAVFYKTMTLDAGEDFIIDEETEPSTDKSGKNLTFRIKGQVNYQGSKDIKVKIVDKGKKTGVIKSGDAVFTDSDAKYVFDGKTKHQPAVEVTVDGTKLGTKDYKVTYKNNVNAGIAQAIVTGKGNYVGTAVLTFNIEQAEAVMDDGGWATIKKNTPNFNGKLQKPAVTVTSKVTNKTLKKNKDYVVYYYNNLNVGENTAHAQIIGIGNYAGQETEVTFSIKQIAFKGTPSKKVFGSNSTKKYGVFYNGKALVAGKDFTAKCDYTKDKKDRYTIYINAVEDDPTCNFSKASKDKKITAVATDIDWTYLGLDAPTE